MAADARGVVGNRQILQPDGEIAAAVVEDRAVGTHTFHAPFGQHDLCLVVDVVGLVGLRDLCQIVLRRFHVALIECLVDAVGERRDGAWRQA